MWSIQHDIFLLSVVWAMLPGGNSQTSPTITGINVVTLYVDQATDTTLTSVTCTDPDGLSVVVSGTFTPASLCSSCFVVEPTNPVAGSYDITFYPAVASFNYLLISEYTITLTCTDGVDNDTTLDVHVRLIPNSPPSFTDGLTVTSTISNTKSITSGTTVITVAATDPNSDPIYFTMTSTPAITNFQIGFTDGQIRATTDLDQVCITQVTFEVTISDGKITNVGPQVITAYLNDANVTPDITNLDATGFVSESVAIGTSLFNVLTSDDGATTTLSMVTFPTTGLSLLQLVGSELQTKAALDYEDFTIRTINVELAATDGACTSPTYTYTLSLTNANEAPVISVNENPQDVYEGNITLIPGWTTTDPDAGDTLSYSITGKTPATVPFEIVASTGTIITTTNYDIDQSANTATLTLTIQVQDAAGLTSGLLEYVLHVLDSNDNNPTFTAGSQDLFLTTTDCATVGTNIGSFAATDLDSSFQNNNVLTYSAVTSNSALTITPSGDVILNSQITAGTSITISVTVTDHGVHPSTLSSLVGGTVTVTSSACPTTTTATAATVTAATVTATTTTLAPNTVDAVSDNLWWVAFGAALGAIFLGLTIFLILTRVVPFCSNMPSKHWCRQPMCRCEDTCRKKKPRKLKKLQPKPKGPAPKQEKEVFWKERFPDDHYAHQPNRNQLPEPANYTKANQDTGRVVTANARVWATNVNPKYDGIL